MPIKLEYDQVINLCKSGDVKRLRYEDFCTGVNQTLSSKETTYPYPKRLALKVLIDFIEVGYRLDQLKKALFYGKNLEEVIEEHRAYYDYGKEYSEIDAWNLTDNRVLHGIIGLATEDVELVEAVIRVLTSDAGLDEVNVLEELGDSEFYKAVLFSAILEDDPNLDLNLKKLWSMVLLKLNLRYQGSFSQNKAINRDLKKERKLLETYR